MRRERFQRSLSEFGINNFNLSKSIGDEYIEICPRKTKLFPYTFELLDYLKSKYSCNIITNGFDKVQHIKLEQSKLTPYFDKIITSEKSGFKKPNPEIFRYALEITRSSKNDSLYIGDDLNIDIPLSVPGVDSQLLNPRDTWSDPAAYDAQAKKLAAQFVANFKQYNVADEIVAAGPKA